MDKKYVTFEELGIGITFLHGMSLYVKTSKTMAAQVLARTAGKVTRKRFKPEEKTERLERVMYKGRDGSKADLDFW